MTGTYANYKKVHTIDFEGKYFKSRGPLNTAPSPQYRRRSLRPARRPRAASWPRSTPTRSLRPANGVEAMRAYRDDIHARMEANGRDPAHCKLLYLVSRSSPTRTTRRWPSGSGGSPARSTSSTCWPRSHPSPRSTSPVRSGRAGAEHVYERRAGRPGELFGRGKGKTLREIVTGSGLTANIPFIAHPPKSPRRWGR